MEKIVDLTMTKLFQFAEYVCRKCSFFQEEPVTIPTPARQELMPTIRFDREEEMVEGELF
jgi:hypothetical protein